MPVFNDDLHRIGTVTATRVDASGNVFGDLQITAPPGVVDPWANKTKAQILDDIFAMNKAMDEAARGAYPPRGYTFPCVMAPVITQTGRTILRAMRRRMQGPLNRYRVDKLRYRRRVFAEIRYGMRIVEASEFSTRYHRCYPAYLRAAASLYAWQWWWGDTDAGWSGNPYKR